MDVIEMGGLRVAKIVKSAGNPPKTADAEPLTIVLMHGYGAPGDDLVSMAGIIDAPPGSTFLFPEAPLHAAMTSPADDARAWWQIDLSRFERAARTGELDELMKAVPPGLAAASDSIERVLDALEGETKTPNERIVLGGFSQGSMLAVDVALRSKRSLAGLAVLSGTVTARDEWLPRMADRKGLPVFQSHGTQDPLLPFRIAEILRGAMETAGLRVTFTSFVGGHGIGPEVMSAFNRWLKELA